MENNEKVISFPHLGDYYKIVKFLFSKLTDIKVMEAPFITKKTIELGSKYSPDFVCLPFKYNLGNYIEALDKGANILFQFGGGCRYGFYGELQEEILKDLGYDFSFYQLLYKGKANVSRVYKIFKKLNSNLKFYKFVYYFLLAFKLVRIIDKEEHFIRANIGFELRKNSFIVLKKKMIDELCSSKGFVNAFYIGLKYKRLFKKLEVNKPRNCLKIGIIGELYTSMEKNASYFLEQELASMNIEIKRFTNVTYLLFTKKLNEAFIKFKTRKYLRYKIGADGMDNVYRSLYFIKHKYDGIIHIKPFGCTPEVGAAAIINRVCNDYKMPIIFFSYDTLNSSTGIRTRLEAFYDLLSMKKEREEQL